MGPVVLPITGMYTCTYICPGQQFGSVRTI